MEIAIVVAAYNRLESLKRILKSLSSAYYTRNVPLIISIDKSNSSVVEDFAEYYNWPHGEKIVIKHIKNLGLKEHILSLGNFFDKYDALIVLEDDLIVSPSFYLYATQTASTYSDNSDIAGISLYRFSINHITEKPFIPVKDENDVFFMNYAQSWGQIWLKKQWLEFYKWYQNNKQFEYSEKLPLTICNWPESSWLKYHIKYCIENNKYFVYPYISYSSNCGDAGTHNKRQSALEYQVAMQMGKIGRLTLPQKIEQSVCYDGFFENKSLRAYLPISDRDCCIDISGGKMNRENKRYWLSVCKCNYKIVKSWGILYKPIEMNVMQDVAGNEIYLYDTYVHDKNDADSRKVFLQYYYVRNVFVLLRKYGIKNCFLN